MYPIYIIIGFVLLASVVYARNIEKLQIKLQRKDVPIKDFSKYIDTNDNTGSSIPSVDDESNYLLYYRYINALRDHYFEVLKSSCGNDLRQLKKKTKQTLNECEDQMIKAIPIPYRDNWQYQVSYSCRYSANMMILL